MHTTIRRLASWTVPRRSAISSGIRPPQPGSPLYIFDRKAKVLQRDRAALDPEASVYDYLKDEVAARVADRLLDISRTFDSVLDLGSGPGYLARHVDPEKVGRMIMSDASEKLLHRDISKEFQVPVERVVADEEELPFPENTFDAVVSCLALHWVNDLPGALTQIRLSLKPDGVFIGALFGGDTLFELRSALQLAEMERDGGVSPHISPFTEVRDVASLLSRAGFAITTVDVDDIVVRYPSAMHLMRDLQGMSESNAVAKRKSVLRRDVIMGAAAAYQSLYGDEKDGSVPATFQVLYAIGWKPHPSQAKPKERGSAKVSLKSIGDPNSKT